MAEHPPLETDARDDFRREVATILGVCLKTDRLAHVYQDEAIAKYGSDLGMVASACFSISHDSICLFRSVNDICRQGWSPSGSVIARTMLDLTISLVAIAKSRTPDLAAFRYLYSTFRAVTHDRFFPKVYRKQVRDTCRQRISTLDPSTRSDALRFLRQEKKLSYWYANEFGRPTDVLERFATPDILEVYRSLSAAAHGGYIGLRLFRDDPYSFDTNPRAPGALTLVVLAMSARILAELIHFRADFERLPSAYLAPILVREFDDVRAAFQRRITKEPDGRDIFNL